MSKLLSITITYSDLTRELKTALQMDGFVADVPDVSIIATEIDTTTLFELPIMSPSDQRAIIQSVARALLSGNVQLGQWASAEANKDKADQISAAAIDPVAAFDSTLNGGEPPPPTDPGAGVIAFDDALNPPL